MHTAFIEVSLKEDHKIGSQDYMKQVREKVQRQLPELQAFFQAGGLVDSIENQGKPAPFDIRVSTNRTLDTAMQPRRRWRRSARSCMT